MRGRVRGTRSCGGDEADAAVEAYEAAVVKPVPDGGEDAVTVAADRARELGERVEF